MRFSSFARAVSPDAGIVRLMDDLGNALREDPGAIMLGGGNPAHVPAVEARLRARMSALLQQPGEFERALGAYGPPEGDRRFAEALARLLRRECGWNVDAENVALTNGSQAAFFVLFNLFSGPYDDGTRRRILLPLSPEYIGYHAQALHPDAFVSARPAIELQDDALFKYRPDFEALDEERALGAVCLSRPTNPTGNVLDDGEIARLARLARARSAPLIIDGAYGLPFPGIVFTTATPYFDENAIVSLSLSKLGLPGVRTGIVIAPPEVVRRLSAANAIINLTTGGFGPALLLELVRSGEILRLADDTIRPWYRDRVQRAADRLRSTLPAPIARLHRPEGAFFLWAWFPGLPIDDEELYRRLRARSVVVLPGNPFFRGLADAWPHRHECIRINCAGEEAQVARGIDIICEEVRRAHDQG